MSHFPAASLLLGRLPPEGGIEKSMASRLSLTKKLFYWNIMEKIATLIP